MKITLYTSLLFFIIFMLSCEKENPNLDIDENLIGEWSETIEGMPQGLIVYNLVIKDDATFVFKTSFFGIYSDQDDQDLSAWSESLGSFEQEDPNIVIFKAKRRTWWDDFYGIPPVS